MGTPDADKQDAAALPSTSRGPPKSSFGPLTQYTQLTTLPKPTRAQNYGVPGVHRRGPDGKLGLRLGWVDGETEPATGTGGKNRGSKDPRRAYRKTRGQS